MNRLLTGIPAGQLSFVIRDSCDCLPTPSILVRWGYSLSHSCPLCNGPHCNVHHVLNCCPTALSDGRYTWQHDQVLSKVYSFLSKFLPSAAKLFVDLPNHRACESPPATVPPDIVVTTARPDIVILHDRRITMHSRADGSLEQCQEHPNGQNEEDGKKQLPTSSVGPVFPRILHQIPHLGNWVPGTFHRRCFHCPEGCCSP